MLAHFQLSRVFVIRKRLEFGDPVSVVLLFFRDFERGVGPVHHVRVFKCGRQRRAFHGPRDRAAQRVEQRRRDMKGADAVQPQILAGACSRPCRSSRVCMTCLGYHWVAAWAPTRNLRLKGPRVSARGPATSRVLPSIWSENR